MPSDNARTTIAPPPDKGPLPQIPGYRILARVGIGAMGTVYRAQQVAMDRTVALKVLFESLAGDRDFVSRFLREARSAARLNHPNIVQGYDAGPTGNTFFLAMEFVEGETVGDVLDREKRLEEGKALAIVRSVALALDHAWQNHMVHRDVKPSNILLARDGTVKLGDLGLARSVELSDRLTLDGQVLGTPAYMSPEQARGEDDIDTRSDIYSLGATLFHMVTGTTPFPGRTIQAIAIKQDKEPVPDPRARSAGVSDALAGLIMWMMSKDREHRPQTPAELIGAIDSQFPVAMPLRPGETTLPRAMTAGGVTPPARGQTWVVPVLAAAAIVLCLALGGVLLFNQGQVQEPPLPPEPPSVPPVVDDGEARRKEEAEARTRAEAEAKRKVEQEAEAKRRADDMAESVTVAAFQDYAKAWAPGKDLAQRISDHMAFARKLAEARGKVKDDKRRAEVVIAARDPLAAALKDLMGALVESIADGAPLPANLSELGEAIKLLGDVAPNGVKEDWQAILAFRATCEAQPKNLKEVQDTWKGALEAAGKAGEDSHRKTLIALCDIEEFVRGFELLKKQADWRTSQGLQAWRDGSKRLAQAILKEPAKYSNARWKAIEPLLREAAALQPPPPQALLTFRKFMETWKPGETLHDRLRNMARAATEFENAQTALRGDAKHLDDLTNEARGKLNAHAQALTQAILVELGKSEGDKWIYWFDKDLFHIAGPSPLREVVGAPVEDWRAVLEYAMARRRLADHLDDLGKRWARAREWVERPMGTKHCQKVLLAVCDLAEFEMGEDLLAKVPGWQTDLGQKMKDLRDQARKWANAIERRLPDPPPPEVADRVKRVKPRVTAMVKLVEPVPPLPPDPLRDLVAEWKGTPGEKQSSPAWLDRLAPLLKKSREDLTDGTRQDVDAIISTVLSGALWAKEPADLQAVRESLSKSQQVFAGWIGKDALEASGAVSDARTSKPSLELSAWDIEPWRPLSIVLQDAGYARHEGTRKVYIVEVWHGGRPNPIWQEGRRLNPQGWFDHRFAYTQSRRNKILVATPESLMATLAARDRLNAFEKRPLVEWSATLDGQLRAACRLEDWAIELRTLLPEKGWPKGLDQVHYDRRRALLADLQGKVALAVNEAQGQKPASPAELPLRRLLEGVNAAFDGANTVIERPKAPGPGTRTPRAGTLALTLIVGERLLAEVEARLCADGTVKYAGREPGGRSDGLCVLWFGPFDTEEERVATSKKLRGVYNLGRPNDKDMAPPEKLETPTRGAPGN
ncbi:MAG: hypothetical protein FJ290_05050 [Planctomycetes bacterium]|nr:hypothetical protein [Planctomycetota bacterium]